MGSCTWMDLGKRKNSFIKDDITENVNTARRDVKALISFVKITIA
jgi:hypothetical protein